MKISSDNLTLGVANRLASLGYELEYEAESEYVNVYKAPQEPPSNQSIPLLG